jgi:hypothetical protein
MLIPGARTTDEDRRRAVVLDQNREARTVIGRRRPGWQLELDRCCSDRLLVGEKHCRTYWLTRIASACIRYRPAFAERFDGNVGLLPNYLTLPRPLHNRQTRTIDGRVNYARF